MSDLEKLVESMIRAEWFFRCGPKAYSPKTQAWFENALDDLRKAATGFSDLGKAGESLGCRIKKEIKRVRFNS